MSVQDIVAAALILSAAGIVGAASFTWGFLLGAQHERLKRVPWVRRSISTKPGGR